MSIQKQFKLALCLVLCTCCGCTSLYLHTDAENWGKAVTRVYPGLTSDATLVVHPNVINTDWYIPPPILVIYGILDFAPSAAVDTLLLPIDLACKRPYLLMNQPSVTNIVRFEAARTLPSGPWRQMSRRDGEFVLSAIQNLQEWHPKREGGSTLQQSTDFSMRAITRDGGRYYITFSTRAEVVWVGSRELEVPISTSTQIVQRLESILNKK